MQLNINKHLQEHLIQLKPEEYSQLEQNIIKHGCRDPLILWGDTLIDGHNRYSICSKHDISFNTVGMEFSNIDDVADWMEDNQLGRRNLTADQFKYLIGRKYNRLKSSHGGDRKSTSSDQNDHMNTADKIGSDYGVSAPTVRRAASVVAAIDGKKTSKLAESVKSGEISFSSASQIVAQPEEKQERIIEKLNSGEAKNVVQAKKKVDQEDRIASAPIMNDSRIRVAQGDCLKLVREMKEMPHVVITDPPYGIEIHNTRDGSKDYADGEQYALKLMDDLCKELVIKCDPSAHFYFFSGYSNLHEFKKLLTKYFDVQDNPLVWVKDNHTMCNFSKAYPNKHEYILFARQKGSERQLAECVSDVLEFSRERSSTHSAEKPTRLLEMLIEQSSVPGEIIFDPFLGSGSTGVAAKDLDRQFVGFELDHEWYNVAISRIA